VGERRGVLLGDPYITRKQLFQLAVHAAALAPLEVARICLISVPLAGLGNLWPSSVGNAFYLGLDSPWTLTPTCAMSNQGLGGQESVAFPCQ